MTELILTDVAENKSIYGF